jgi:DNA-binding CsgD family transcriptional regulator
MFLVATRTYGAVMASGSGALLTATAGGGDVRTAVRAVADMLRARLGAGPVFLALADPSSQAFSGTFTFDIPDEAAGAFLAIEMAGHDVVTFRGLAGASVPVGSLFAATEGAPERSTRWREVVAPLGWGDEVRAAVRANSTVCGYLCLHREGSDRPFSPRELQRLNATLPIVAGVLRRASLTWSEPEARLETGVVLVDAVGRVAGSTGGAAEWLDEMQPTLAGGLPLVLAGLVSSVMDSGRSATSTVVTRAGRVAVVEAAPLEVRHERHVAVVLSAATAAVRLERFAAAVRLTSREHEVVTCVLEGMSTRAMAHRLGISERTVQAHLTAVFDKAGVRSRRELGRRLHAGGR